VQFQLADDDWEQIPFLARLAYADAGEFAWPDPLWDIASRAKKAGNPAGYLKSKLMREWPARWQEFDEQIPDDLHCWWLVLQLREGKLKEGNGQ
jgi:hypothetical protein